MSDLKQLLLTANIKQAVIVDDAYDQVPLATDMSLDRENWAQFFDDLNDADKNQLRGLFPRYDQLRADELQNQNDFIAVLWNERARLRGEVITPLFARYDRDKIQDLAYLETLKGRLREYGIHCETAGRNFEEKGEKADLIVIDLYLGSDRKSTRLNSSHRCISYAV